MHACMYVRYMYTQSAAFFSFYQNANKNLPNCWSKEWLENVHQCLQVGKSIMTANYDQIKLIKSDLSSFKRLHSHHSLMKTFILKVNQIVSLFWWQSQDLKCKNIVNWKQSIFGLPFHACITKVNSEYSSWLCILLHAYLSIHKLTVITRLL